MKSSAFTLRQISLCLVVASALLSSADGFVPPRQVKQTPEVIEAYRVCASFAHLLGGNLDVANFRAHLDRLSYKYPFVAERVRSFRSEALSAKVEPSNTYKVNPGFGYLRADVLGKDEPYYDIDGFIVARDHDKMRIVGI